MSKEDPVYPISEALLYQVAAYYAAGYLPETLENPDEANVLRYTRGLISECGLDDKFDLIVEKLKNEQMSNKEPVEILSESETQQPVQAPLFPLTHINEEIIAAKYLTANGKKNYKCRRDRQSKNQPRR